MATLQSGKCFTVPTFFGMCCRSEWQERMYIYKWHEVDQTKHEIFCVHVVCNEIQVKVNLEITTFFFYLRFPYCPNFFWFGVVHLIPHLNLTLGPGACTMMVDEQIQSYRISFELTKPDHSNLALLVPWSWSSIFSCQLRLDPELMERVHMNVWHQRQTANHNTEQVWFTSRERASEIQNSFVKG